MCQSFPAINPNPFPPAGHHFLCNLPSNTPSSSTPDSWQPFFVIYTWILEHVLGLTVDGTDLVKTLVQVVDRVVEGEDDELGQSLCAHVACQQPTLIINSGERAWEWGVVLLLNMAVNRWEGKYRGRQGRRGQEEWRRGKLCPLWSCKHDEVAAKGYLGF